MRDSQEHSGVVKSLAKDRGFGFIRPDAGGADVWFSIRWRSNELGAELAAGDRVVYLLDRGRDGRPQGQGVRPAAAAAAAVSTAAAKTPAAGTLYRPGHASASVATVRSGQDAAAGGSSAAVASEREGSSEGASDAATVLIRSIKDSETAVQLEELVRLRVEKFSHVHVTAALKAVTEHLSKPQTDKQVLQHAAKQLAQHGCTISNTFSPENIADTIWALLLMTRHDMDGERELVGALARRARDIAGSFNAQNVVDSLCALAKLQVEGEGELVGALARRARDIAGSFKAQEVANTLWAVKRLRLSRTQIQECRMCLEELALRCRNQQAQQTPGAGDGGDGGAGRPKLTKGQKKNLKKKNHKAAGAGAASN